MEPIPGFDQGTDAISAGTRRPIGPESRYRVGNSMSTGNTSLGVFRALRLDDEVRGRLIQSSMSTRYPIVIGALIAAILFAVSGIPRMEWGIGACAMIALEGVVAKRYPSVPRTIVSILSTGMSQNVPPDR